MYWGCAVLPTEETSARIDVGRARDTIKDLIQDVSVQPWTFNPATGQTVEIGYQLAEAARVTLIVYGPNQERIATVVDGEPRDAGRHRETWDGRDGNGRIVADEAYYPMIEAQGGRGLGRYDPLAHSGGERINPRDIHFNSRDGIISYVLPRTSRVLVRAGLDPGPMLTTMVNWQPRGPGLSTETWKGRDQQGLRSFIRDPNTLVIVQAYALPENSMIAVGSREESYRKTYLSRGKDRPRKAPAQRQGWLDTIASPHWGQPVHLDKDPEIAVYMPELEPGLAARAELARAVTLSGDQAVFRIVATDEDTRQFLLDQRFELVVFLDDVRIAEAEQASLPFNWAWDLSKIGPGEHWLTFNLVTFRQHVGVFTRRVEVVANGEDSE